MKSIELYSGIGGLGIGVKRAGFEQVAAIEYNKFCCDTLHHNKSNGLKDLKDWNIINNDVNKIDFKKFESKIELVSGGPPCQPFSLGGKHLGNLDKRDLFPATISAIRDVRPKAFILENVRGLLRESFSSYFEYLLLQLSYPEIKRRPNETLISHVSRLEKIHTKGSRSDTKYNVIFKVLNAADFGLPQKRERVFLVGIRSDLNVSWTFPSPTHSQEAMIWSQVHGSYWDNHRIPLNKRTKLNVSDISKQRPFHLPWKTLREAINDLPDPERFPNKARFIPNHTLQPGARAYKGHTGSVLDEPAKTLKAGSHGVPGGENAIRKFDGSLRYLTVRESARLQGFPDNFIFNGTWGQTMMQLGNAVPIPLAEIIAKSLRKALIKK